MAILSPAQRKTVHRELARRFRGSDLSGQPSLHDKTNVDAMLSGLDGAFEGVMAQLNLGIPQPMRGEMTAKQKAAVIEVLAKVRREEGVF